MNITITCGCGRTLTPEPRWGRGNYRCGCGVRIIVEEGPQATKRCVGAADDGTPCRLVVTRTDPFPLCCEHYEASGLKELDVWRRKGPEELADLINSRRWQSWAPHTVEGRVDTEEFQRRWVAYAQQQERAAKSNEYDADPMLQNGSYSRDRAVVYFLRIGDLVKIGTTTNLTHRLRSFSHPEMKLLATEPGHYEREAELHRQFRAHRHQGEWFRPARPLMAYIDALPGRRP